MTPSAVESPAPAPEAAPSSSLPILPDTPTTEIEAQHGQLRVSTGEDRGSVNGENNPNTEVSRQREMTWKTAVHETDLDCPLRPSALTVAAH